jgi:hypothetical protein
MRNDARERVGGRIRQPQGRSQYAGNELGIRERGQVQKAGTMLVGGQQLFGDGKAQGGLANSAWADDRSEARSLEAALSCFDSLVSSDCFI